MYANVNAGHAQLLVSRRITASVEAHWQHSAKNTITDSATAHAVLAANRVLRPVVLHRLRQPAAFSFASSSAASSPIAPVSTSPSS